MCLFLPLLFSKGAALKSKSRPMVLQLAHGFLLAIILLLSKSENLRAADPPASLPPVPKWSGASEGLIVPADHPWITPTEATGMTDTPSYDVTIAWLKKVASASPLVKVVPLGLSAEGRELYAVIASKEGVDDYEKLPATGRPTVLAQCGIHSGEIDGKDAGMMLLRDIAFRGKAHLLDKANLVFVPVLNADGHERRSEWNRPNQRGPHHQGWRTTAQNLNLNRDYMKAQAPEMRAILRLLHAVKPALYLDVHVTDGVDYQYDITYGFHGWRGSFAWSPKIGVWLDEHYRPTLDADLKAAGHIPGPLVFATNDRDLSDGITDAPSNPRFSSGYGDLAHIPTILVENHSLKPFRQRVLGTYILFESSFKTIGAKGAGLKVAIEADSSARPQTIGVNWGEVADQKLTIKFLGIAEEVYDSPASGAQEVRWLGEPRVYPRLPLNRVTQPGVILQRPKAYYIPVSKPEIIAILESHGIQLERLEVPRALELEEYRYVDPVVSATPFENRHMLVTRVKAASSRQTLPAGTVRVSTDQPLGDLAVALLEPEHVDSLAGWGFASEVLQRTEYIEGYVIAPLAEKMLRDDPTLKSEFEARLAADPAFAKSPTARLQWFYQRSPYFDERHLLYPIKLER
ncbi:MAG: carboxypeptidase [Planctomyces sp.]|nr:carboxypeptidase [Planctomyces sp.]